MGKESKPARPVRPRPNAGPGRGPRLVLPFEKRPKDAGSWAYEHRVGLCCMVIAYLALGIVFVSAKIVINQRTPYNTVYVDMTELMARMVPEPEREIRQDNDASEDFSNVRNRVSDESGSSESVGKTAAGSAGEAASRAVADYMEGIDEEAAAVAARLKGSRDALEKGRREEQEMIDRHKAQREAKDGEKVHGVKEKGKVLVSYYLPGRVEARLHIPAYQCDGGGEITINITVDRNGKVVSANVKESSTSSRCINETALMAARNSRFNVDGNAENRQNGTITYIFVPQ